MRLGSSNPVFRRAINQEYAFDTEQATYAGVAKKVFYYIIMTLVGAFGGLFLLINNTALFGSLLALSLFTTFIFGLIAMMIPRGSKIFGTLYCLGEGMVVGVVSMAFEVEAPGVIMIALLSTIIVLTVVATLFLTNVVKVTSKFYRFLMAFSISVILSMFILWILNLTIYNGTVNFGLNLLVSVIMTFLATLYLFFDLENIRQVVEGGAPKYMEWYVSFGLVFTIVWLYMEVLPIIFRALSRRD